MLAGAAMGETYVYNSTMVGTENKTSVHGFTFVLDSAAIAAETGSVPTTEISDFELVTLTLGDRDANASTRAYGLLVLDSSNVILGKSNETNTGGNSTDDVFTFTNLILNADTTYSFVTVNTTLFTTDYVGKTYGYGKETSLTLNGGTITGGLVAAPIAVDYHTDSSTPYLAITTSATFASTTNTQSPILSNITINVPEPATATLSLLAFAGLAARRRRH